MNFNSLSVKFFEYLEKIRLKRNISQELFIDGIVSMRQYRRYLSGECSFSFESLIRLCNKLGYNVQHAFELFEKERMIESKNITDLYTQVLNQNSSFVINSIFKEPGYTFLDEENEKLFNLANLLHQFHSGNESKIHTLECCESYLDINIVLKKQLLNNYELIILLVLMQFDSYKKNTLIIDKLLVIILNNDDYFSVHNIGVILLVTQQLSKFLIKNKNFDILLKICQLGINISKIMKSYFLLDYLLYYKIIALDYLRNYDELFLTINECNAAIQMNNNNNLKKYLNEVIIKHKKTRL